MSKAKSSLVDAGWLLKLGGFRKSWKRRYFVLRSRFLLYFEFAEKTLKEDAKGIVPLDGAMVCPFPTGMYSVSGRSLFFFGLAPKDSDRIYVMAALSSEERRQWVASLVEQGCVVGERLYAQESDDARRQCSCCESPFGIFNRRHHCRVCGQLVCAECSNHTRIVPMVNRTKEVRVCVRCVVPQVAKVVVERKRATSHKDEPQEHSYPMFPQSAWEGFLLKQGGFVKNWKLRYFCLIDQDLFYFRECMPRASQDAQGEHGLRRVHSVLRLEDELRRSCNPLQFNPLGRVSLSGAKVTRAPSDCEKPHSLVISHPERTRQYLLGCGNQERATQLLKLLGARTTFLYQRDTPSQENNAGDSSDEEDSEQKRKKAVFPFTSECKILHSGKLFHWVRRAGEWHTKMCALVVRGEKREFFFCAWSRGKHFAAGHKPTIIWFLGNAEGGPVRAVGDLGVPWGDPEGSSTSVLDPESASSVLPRRPSDTFVSLLQGSEVMTCPRARDTSAVFGLVCRGLPADSDRKELSSDSGTDFRPIYFVYWAGNSQKSHTIWVQHITAALRVVGSAQACVCPAEEAVLAAEERFLRRFAMRRDLAQSGTGAEDEKDEQDWQEKSKVMRWRSAGVPCTGVGAKQKGAFHLPSVGGNKYTDEEMEQLDRSSQSFISKLRSQPRPLESALCKAVRGHEQKMLSFRVASLAFIKSRISPEQYFDIYFALLGVDKGILLFNDVIGEIPDVVKRGQLASLLSMCNYGGE